MKVMVAEDDIAQSSMYCDFLTKDKEIEIVSQTIDGKDTLEKYLDLRPDLLILDLNLPTINGMEIIERLNLLPEERKKCNIIIVSGRNDYRNNVHKTQKVFMSLDKPIDYDRLLKYVQDFKIEYIIPPKVSEADLRHLLTTFNVQPYSKNSTILIDSILLASNRQELLYNIKDLYSVIGYTNNMDYKQIKWRIRNAINNINNRMDENLKQKFFNLPTKNANITPTYFFAKVLEYYENK